MIKSSIFSAFGRRYKTTQFSAVRALEIMDNKSSIHPCEMLETTFAARGDAWVSLSEGRAINELVLDEAGIIPPRAALVGVVSLINQFNFEFLSNWKGARVPRRFIDGAQSVSSTNSDPLIAQLVGDGVASIKELEEFYSLKDAFMMFDIIMVRGINQALSQEAAMRDRKK